MKLCKDVCAQIKKFSKFVFITKMTEYILFEKLTKRAKWNTKGKGVLTGTFITKTLKIFDTQKCDIILENES